MLFVIGGKVVELGYLESVTILEDSGVRNDQPRRFSCLTADKCSSNAGKAARVKLKSCVRNMDALACRRKCGDCPFSDGNIMSYHIFKGGLQLPSWGCVKLLSATVRPWVERVTIWISAHMPTKLVAWLSLREESKVTFGEFPQPHRAEH